MNVRDMIHRLQQMPPELPIRLLFDDGHGDEFIDEERISVLLGTAVEAEFPAQGLTRFCCGDGPLDATSVVVICRRV